MLGDYTVYPNILSSLAKLDGINHHSVYLGIKKVLLLNVAVFLNTLIEQIYGMRHTKILIV
jgi:hypothetical protein